MSIAARRDSILPTASLTLPSSLMLASSRGRLRVPEHIIVMERFILQAIMDGDQLLTIEAPVRHGKSVYVDWHLPFWFLGTFPHKSVGLASHEASFASSWSAKARDSMIEYGASFGVQVSRDIRSRAWWEIEGHGGSMRSFGISGGGITGRGFDLLILDDLIKNAADADSEVHRDAQWEFLTGTAMSRLEPGEYDPEKAVMRPGATMIVMMARWHEDDLIGRIHQEMPGQWRRLRLPAIAEEPDEEHPGPDPMGRPPGAVLWPSRFPIDNLQRRRERSGEYYFNALYQQRPSSPLGTIFKRSWWRRWSTLPALDYSGWSWDMSFKDKEDSSFVVGQLWGVRGADFYLRRQVRGQWGFADTKAKLLAEVTNPAHADAKSTVLIEDKANGTAIIDDLRSVVGGLIPIQTGQDSKIARARSITGYVEGGNVYLPEQGVDASFDDDGAAWVPAFINEHASFPKGAHDDQVDATSQAIRELLKRSGGAAAAPSGDLPQPRRG